jgi:PASTA domain
VRPRVAIIVVAIFMLGPASCTDGGSPSPSNVITSSVRQVVNVPRLIGLPVMDAQRRLADLGLKLGNVTVHTGVSIEAVIRGQHPSAGTSVSLGTAVNVLSGAATVRSRPPRHAVKLRPLDAGEDRIQSVETWGRICKLYGWPQTLVASRDHGGRVHHRWGGQPTVELRHSGGS